MKERKWSTVWTTDLPSGTAITAASSGSSRPISTSSRARGRMPATMPASKSGPTLAPQPPQRMSRSGIRGSPGAGAGAGSGAISGRSVYLRIQRRSIRSFTRHTQRPDTARPPREATAWASPVEIRLSQARCGR